MQTPRSFTERSDFLAALLHRHAHVAMGAPAAPSETTAYSLGYLLGVIAGKPELYASVMEELASLGLSVD